jgi:DNA-directed RNA polymerase
MVATGKVFNQLVAVIDQERTRPRGKGRPPLWINALGHRTTSDIAAGTIYVILQALIRVASEDDVHDVAADDDALPLLLTVGSTLGAALRPTALEKEQQQVGVQLLGLAALAKVIDSFTDRPEGASARIELTAAGYTQIAELVNGGASHAKSAVRTHPPTGAEVKRPRDMKLPRPDAPMRVVEAADKVQGTAWRINHYTLNTLRTVGVADELARIKQLKGTGRQRRTRLWRETLVGMLVIAQAQALCDTVPFYLPVFLDSRGRMYQRGGMLTHTSGSDYARGLLEFANGEPLDDRGMGWLTWHLMQMWGKGITDSNNLPLYEFGDGRAWVNAKEQKWLLPCARDPVANQEWRNAKHPAQFLAALGSWLDVTNGKRCHLPIRLDAPCSGLQHLTLLARDEDLARHVQLWGDLDVSDRQSYAYLDIPSEDFYTVIAGATSTRRDQAKTVLVPMLYTAGVEKCAKALAVLRTDGKSSEASESDTALSERIRASAREQAPRAFDVLAWFGRVAQAHNDAPKMKEVRIRRAHWSEVTPQPIRWTTPSGFEAVQDYHKIDRSWPTKGKSSVRSDRRVEITVNGHRLQLVKRVLLDDLDTAQQEISLPANIVHSLDAALLAETVAGADIDQWAVAHDAFGVPPSKVPALINAYVEGIRTMYTGDRLAEWAADWRASGVNVPDPPGIRGRLPKEMLGGLRSIG